MRSIGRVVAYLACVATGPLVRVTLGAVPARPKQESEATVVVRPLSVLTRFLLSYDCQASFDICRPSYHLGRSAVCGQLKRPTARSRATDPKLLLPRRAILAGASLIGIPALSKAATVSAPGFEAPGRGGPVTAYPPGFEPPRVPGVGGGLDLFGNSILKDIDVFYPPSLIGTWLCERTVLSVDGDPGQARGCWRLLGGSGDIQKPESYLVQYIAGPSGSNCAVLDRGFEIVARVSGANVSWDATRPDTLSYQRDSGGPGSAATFKVVQRTVELPTDKGWGSNEILRISTANSVLGANLGDINYAARVQRRFRRAFTESGDRVIEGLEIVKTYRVNDGIAGVEYPTSTTRSSLRLTRPTAPAS